MPGCNEHGIVFEEDPAAGFSGPVAVGLEVIQAALQSVNHSRREAIMGNFSEPFVQQGEAKALVRLLEKRFGPIPPSLHERIFASDVISIEAWIDRAVEARELLSVFEPKGHHSVP